MQSVIINSGSIDISIENSNIVKSVSQHTVSDYVVDYDRDSADSMLDHCINDKYFIALYNTSIEVFKRNFNGKYSQSNTIGITTIPANNNRKTKLFILDELSELVVFQSDDNGSSIDVYCLESDRVRNIDSIINQTSILDISCVNNYISILIKTTIYEYKFNLSTTELTDTIAIVENSVTDVKLNISDIGDGSDVHYLTTLGSDKLTINTYVDYDELNIVQLINSVPELLPIQQIATYFDDSVGLLLFALTISTINKYYIVDNNYVLLNSFSIPSQMVSNDQIPTSLVGDDGEYLISQICNVSGSDDKSNLGIYLMNGIGPITLINEIETSLTYKSYSIYDGILSYVDELSSVKLVNMSGRGLSTSNFMYDAKHFISDNGNSNSIELSSPSRSDTTGDAGRIPIPINPLNYNYTHAVTIDNVILLFSDNEILTLMYDFSLNKMKLVQVNANDAPFNIRHFIPATQDNPAILLWHNTVYNCIVGKKLIDFENNSHPLFTSDMNLIDSADECYSSTVINEFGENYVYFAFTYSLDQPSTLVAIKLNLSTWKSSIIGNYDGDLSLVCKVDNMDDTENTINLTTMFGGIVGSPDIIVSNKHNIYPVVDNNIIPLFDDERNGISFNQVLSDDDTVGKLDIKYYDHHNMKVFPVNTATVLVGESEKTFETRVTLSNKNVDSELTLKLRDTVYSGQIVSLTIVPELITEDTLPNVNIDLTFRHSKYKNVYETSSISKTFISDSELERRELLEHRHSLNIDFDEIVCFIDTDKHSHVVSLLLKFEIID